VRDGTERRRAEERARLLAVALESVADPVCITDTAGAIQYVNDAFSRQNGYDIAEVQGKNPRFLKSGQTDPAVHAALWRDLTAGHVFSGLVVNRRKDGSTYEATLTAAPVRMASGTVTHYVSTHRDMTERRQSEEAVRRAGAELRALVDHAAFGIYRSTRDGRLLMVNQALVEMLGYDSAEELLALDLTSDVYLRPEERSRALGLYAVGDLFQGNEVDWKRKDGTPIRVRLSGRSVPAPAAELETFEVFVEDITERRTLEERLRQSQKMEAVGQLAGGMAHDFNNLLAAMLAHSELVSAELPPDSPLAQDLDAIHQAALKGAELTRKLLAFGRRQHLELQPIDLGPLVADFGRMMRRMIREDIQMRVIVEEAKLVVLADPGAVEQVLMNLVTNARDAIPSQGTLLLHARRTVLDGAYCQAHGWGKPGEYVVLEVSDTGAGMDEVTKQRIFEPFFTTKPVGAGTGLGMAMVYGLVKQHDGYVDVYSELGRGTTVRVYLPAVAEAPERPVAATPLELRGGTETILLAEDEEALRHATKRVLERHGYTVLTAADGAEALDAFQTHRAEIALVISDVVMPGMGGAELFRKLQLAGHRVRFLFTSGYTAPDVEATAKLPSGIPFLSKPLAAADLLWKVRAVLDAPL
ncbi:MAG: PAS domain S-box protein, partial [Gemmatimonadota bacterium]